MLGLVLLVLTDHASGAGGDNPLLGDALVLMGATVYAFCNVAQVHEWRRCSLAAIYSAPSSFFAS